MTERRPNLIAFCAAFLIAPVIVGAVISLFGLGGEYGARFARVGFLGLFIMLPGYLLVFSVLAWSAAKKGAEGIKPYVFAGLWANAAHLLLYPAMILFAVLSGAYDRGVAIVQAQQDTATIAAPSPFAAALFAGFAVFFLGLFFMPPIAAVFGWIAKRIRLT